MPSPAVKRAFARRQARPTGDMVRDAYRFLVPLALLAAVCGILGFRMTAAAIAFLALFVAFFFRNPAREIPQQAGLIVSPADGRIVRIAEAPPGEGDAGSSVVSIFLSVFDVHVNRAPIAGAVIDLQYRRGRFKAAYRDDASSLNEQNVLTIQGDSARIVVRQIAGLIARRVVCWKKAGMVVSRGELIGLIRFGSRVDIVLPPTAKLRVRVGDRVRGGSSVIGEFE